MAGDGTTLAVRLGFDELSGKRSGIWQALVAEFIGTLILNFFGCGACVNSSRQTTSDFVLIALTFGLAVFAAVSAIGHVSGGHINPAVTAALAATGKVRPARALLYVVAQCAGAAAGSAILRALTPDAVVQATGLGATSLSANMTPLQGFGIEFFLGFVLLFVVFGVCDQNKPDARACAPLTIGLTVTLGHLLAVQYTGSAMNPARAFGSALVTNTWPEYHWVYWVGPVLGAVTAALLYTHVLAAPAPAVEPPRYHRAPADESELKRLDGKTEDLA